MVKIVQEPRAVNPTGACLDQHREVRTLLSRYMRNCRREHTVAHKTVWNSFHCCNISQPLDDCKISTVSKSTPPTPEQCLFVP